MKRIIAILIAALVVIGLAACSPINSGTVTGKQYIPGYSYTENNCVEYDNNDNCIESIATLEYVPPVYRLTIHKGKDDGWVDVPSFTWQQTDVGSYYPRTQG